MSSSTLFDADLVGESGVRIEVRTVFKVNATMFLLGEVRCKRR